jgi:hypothetical protein
MRETFSTAHLAANIEHNRRIARIRRNHPPSVMGNRFLYRKPRLPKKPQNITLVSHPLQMIDELVPNICSHYGKAKIASRLWPFFCSALSEPPPF